MSDRVFKEPRVVFCRYNKKSRPWCATMTCATRAEFSRCHLVLPIQRIRPHIDSALLKAGDIDFPSVTVGNRVATSAATTLFAMRTIEAQPLRCVEGTKIEDFLIATNITTLACRLGSFLKIVNLTLLCVVEKFLVHE